MFIAYQVAVLNRADLINMKEPLQLGRRKSLWIELRPEDVSNKLPAGNEEFCQAPVESLPRYVGLQKNHAT